MFRYSITDEDYLDMSRHILKKRRGSKTAAILKLLLKTVVQMGVAVFLIFFYNAQVEAWLKWTVGILSVLWALLSLFQFFFTDTRAKMLLTQAKNNAGSADFWKEHHLDAADDRLRLSYGAARLELSFSEVTAIEETDALYLIFRGRDLFELIPKRALSDSDWAAFREKILSGRERVAAERAAGFKKVLLEEASFAKYLTLTREELAEKTVKMKRLSLRYPFGWSVSMAFGLFFPLGLAIYSVIGGSWPAAALCMAAFLLFNMRFFVIFTPSYKQLIQNKLPEPGEEGYLLALKDRTVYLVTSSNAISASLAGLKKQIAGEDGLYLFFEKQEMMFVPRAVSDAFQIAAGYKKSLRAKAAAGVQAEEEALPEAAAEAGEVLPEAAAEAGEAPAAENSEEKA